MLLPRLCFLPNFSGLASPLLCLPIRTCIRVIPLTNTLPSYRLLDCNYTQYPIAHFHFQQLIPPGQDTCNALETSETLQNTVEGLDRRYEIGFPNHHQQKVPWTTAPYGRRRSIEQRRSGDG